MRSRGHPSAEGRRSEVKAAQVGEKMEPSHVSENETEQASKPDGKAAFQRSPFTLQE